MPGVLNASMKHFQLPVYDNIKVHSQWGKKLKHFPNLTLTYHNFLMRLRKSVSFIPMF